MESTATVVLGSQWGDEGKGKLVDILAQQADVVCRCAGGNNAGHTVVAHDANGKEVNYDFHLLPSGLLKQDSVCVLGNGVVIHIPSLFDEIDKNTLKGLKNIEERLVISSRAHIVLDLHQRVDGLEEQVRGGMQIGTTKKGIGPTYSSKMNRNGLRVCDLVSCSREQFTEKVKTLVSYYYRLYSSLIFGDVVTNGTANGVVNGAANGVSEESNKDKSSADQYLQSALDKLANHEVERVFSRRDRLAPLVRETVAYLHEAFANGRRVLIEGANATMLDIDFGTYPYVTSSNCTVGGVLTGLGVPPMRIGTTIGVVKAYTTRVGSGAFPTELTDELGARLQEIGQEFGVTTGRKRRCGWLDLVVVRYSHMINGFSALALTKLDVLDTFDEVRVCIAYRLDGKETHELPADQATLQRLTPVYITLPGWCTKTADCRSWSELPSSAQLYVDLVESVIGVHVKWIGVGQRRDAMLLRPSKLTNTASISLRTPASASPAQT